MAVVYQHRRKDMNEIFYIGIGATESRAYETAGRSKYWKNIVNKVGYEIDILIKNLSWEDVCIIEKGLIADFGRKDLRLGPLVNLTDGGDGCLGREMTAETREKIAKKHRGRSLSDDHKQKLSEARKNRVIGPHSDDHKKKISEANKNKKFSENHKKSLSLAHANVPRPWRLKKVYQYTLEHTLVGTYKSYSEALATTGIKGIGNNLSGRAKTAGGFIWSYKKI